MTSQQRSQSRDMARLVKRRSEVQDLLFRLWRFGNRHLDDLKHPYSTVFHLLLGAAFSLWRAAFLVEGRRTIAEMNEHALEFLRFLTWDNAINYPQDRATRAWTVGYYLNNAHLRLRSAIGLLKPRGKNALAFNKVRVFVRTQTRLGNHVPDMQAGWDDAYAAVKIGFQILRDQRKTIT